MEGYLLLADGTRLDGELKGAPQAAVGRLVANTAVVGFQEMTTDPAYRGAVLAFTYPEVGSVGVTGAFNESDRVQVAALVVKVLSEFRSHYRAERDLEEALREQGVPCLCGVDTRGVAVHLREHGEMAAAVAPAEADPDELRERLAAFEPLGPPPAEAAGAEGNGPQVAVVDLGIRRSDLAQLRAVCRPARFPWSSSADDVLAAGPAGVVLSDGPALSVPPQEAVELVRGLLGRAPVLAFGLGHVALGMGLGCAPTFLGRGHHGANYPVRDLASGRAEVTAQRHSVALDRAGVEASDGAELLCENINDGTVEGIRSADGSAVGIQWLPAVPRPGLVNARIRAFIEGLAAE